MSNMVEKVADVFCQSGKFETGQGCCAAVCMDQLGSARSGGCRHAAKVHSKLARAAIEAMREPDEMVFDHGHAAAVQIDFLWGRLTHTQALELRKSYLPTAWQAGIHAVLQNTDTGGG